MNTAPAEIARASFKALSLVERQRLMNMHMQGFDGKPILQQHMETKFEELQQQIDDVSEAAHENIKCIAALHKQQAEDLKNVGYLDGIDIQIQALHQAIKSLSLLERDLNSEVQNASMSMQERNAKIRELTAYIQQMQKILTSARGRETAVTKGMYSVGDNMSRSMLGMEYAASPSNRNATGGPDIMKIKRGF